MKTLRLLLIAVTTSVLFTLSHVATAQGTAFTYQGRLNSGANPANGTYDFTFSLFNIVSGGGALYGPVNVGSVGVTNGLFTVQIDFGAGVFAGTTYWLDIGVRSNGVVSYTTLTPRQKLTPTPYAIFAEGANATGLSGTVPSGNLSGAYSGAVNFNNAGNSFTGNGSGLTGVNAASLNGLNATNFWKTTGNAGTTPGVNYLGTPDNKALEFKVNGARGLRIEPDIVYSIPNIIGGSPANFIGQNTVGNFIGGGGENNAFSDATNFINAANMNVIAGGYGNRITNGISPVYEGTIAGGYYNSLSGLHAAIGGGAFNFASGLESTIPGGANNVASGDHSFAAGQHAQALHDGSFVWADNSSTTDFASGSANQFLVRTRFLGLNRNYPLSGNEWFGIYAPISNDWGGMYIQTLVNGRPFYGYNNPGGTAWTELDGTDTNKWKLWTGFAYRLTVDTSGNVGIGTTTPTSKLEVNNGDVKIDDHDLFLTATSTTNNGSGLGHRVGMPGITANGPFLYGYDGGALGGLSPTTVALSWSYTGDVWVNKNLSTTSLTVRDGPIRVSGAGVGANKAVFIHVATAATLVGNYTIITNSFCDGDPNALLFVTPTLTPNNVYNNHAIGVWYNGSHWTIFEQDNATVPVNAAFNVMIIKN
jgi:hypothetical protein